MVYILRSFSTSTDTSNEAEATLVDHQNEIISQIAPQDPIEECPVEEKIDQCMVSHRNFWLNFLINLSLVK